MKWACFGPIVIGFDHRFHAGNNPEWWCWSDDWDYWSYVVLPQ